MAVAKKTINIYKWNTAAKIARETSNPCAIGHYILQGIDKDNSLALSITEHGMTHTGSYDGYGAGLQKPPNRQRVPFPICGKRRRRNCKRENKRVGAEKTE